MTLASTRRTPVSYTLIRWLFKFVLKLFYGTIVIENAEYLPKKGESCILCANHGNSLTDSLILVTSSKEHLRLSAKSTLFGKRTFSSWLIEQSGALPIKRRMDNPDSKDIDNSEVMEKLYQALSDGHTVCFFPEGMSKYRSALAPLKTGVARILSEVLTRNRDDPNFQITLLTCSITYMHRQHFRSDVLVSFNPPVKFKPQDHPSLLAPVDFRSIKSLTDFMANQISAGTLDAPSWDFIHTAKVASRIYAPLGTKMTLGDYVRVTRLFVEGFLKTGKRWDQRNQSYNQKYPVLLEHNPGAVSPEDKTLEDVENDKVDALAQGLNEYNAQLMRLGLRDERIRIGPLPRRTILWRILARASWLGVLSIILLPGLLLWAPVFAATKVFSSKYARVGDPEDVWDEIAQNKLLAGLFTGLLVWSTCILFTLPIAPFTFFLVPGLMWMSLRWFEDAVSAFRALAALTSLLWIGKPTLLKLALRREQLHSRVMNLAVENLGLPENPETYFQERGGREKGRVRGLWDSSAGYFSLRRRRKKAWDEILRIWPHEE